MNGGNITILQSAVENPKSNRGCSTMRLNNLLLSPAHLLTCALSLLLLLPVTFYLFADEEAKPEFVIEDGGHTATVGNVTFSPDGRTIATGSDDGTIRVWRVEDGKCLRVLRGHGGNVHVVYSPDGNLLASVGSDADYGVRLWGATMGYRNGRGAKGIEGYNGP